MNKPLFFHAKLLQIFAQSRNLDRDLLNLMRLMPEELRGIQGLRIDAVFYVCFPIPSK